MKDRRTTTNRKRKEDYRCDKYGGGTGFSLNKSQANDYRLQKFGCQTHSSEVSMGNEGGEGLGTREHKEVWRWISGQSIRRGQQEKGFLKRLSI